MLEAEEYKTEGLNLGRTVLLSLIVELAHGRGQWEQGGAG